MAEVTSRVCDSCGKGKDVDTLTIVYRFGEQPPWDVDLCQRCYEHRFKDLLPKARKTKRHTTRPQYRLVQTPIGPENL